MTEGATPSAGAKALRLKANGALPSEPTRSHSSIVDAIAS